MLSAELLGRVACTVCRASLQLGYSMSCEFAGIVDFHPGLKLLVKYNSMNFA